jgi:hypothetical protein
MRLFYLLVTLISLIIPACKKTNDTSRPKSKTDYIPIIYANSPTLVRQGQLIRSRVKCGFAEYFADITFLNFEIKEPLLRHYDIRAKAFYNNIIYDYSLPVVMSFDTTLTLQTPTTGQYILRLYNFNQLVETDTVQVN